MLNDFLMRLVLAVFTTLVFSRLALAEPLLMVYRDKPPYSYIDNGVAKGFLLERTVRILKRAGIEARFREMPPNRIFMEIQKNEQAICSFGWYKNPEREVYARFSEVFHQDRPHVVLAGERSIKAVRQHSSLKALMSDPALSLATIYGLSYGLELDAMIAAFPGKVDSTLQSPLDVAKKIAARRVDFMLIDQDDLDYLKASDSSFKDNGLVRIEYPNMPAGMKRYILCSRQVGEDVLRRINSAMAAEVRH